MISGTYAAGAGRGRMPIQVTLTVVTRDASEIVQLTNRPVLILHLKLMRDLIYTYDI